MEGYQKLDSRNNMVTVPRLTPYYEKLAGVQIIYATSFWITCTLLFGLNCLLSGLQFAIMLSSVKPIVVMSRASGKGGAKGSTLRRTFVVGQFAVAVVVIAFTVVIYRQLQFTRQQDKGMNIEHQQYRSDVRFGQIISVFSIFTIFIICLGLLGLTAHNIAHRTKEIGIRKVLGASIMEILL